MRGQATIGIPVCNEIIFIKDTLDSVIDQADKIVISDNASTDGTSELCQDYAKIHSKIKYFRHEERQNVVDNFTNCLNRSETEYFMWMGGHDLLSKNYIRSLKKNLEEQDVVLAYSNSVHLTEDHAFQTYYQYDFANELSSSNPSVRVKSVIRDITDCTLYYGLYKREALQQICSIMRLSKIDGIDHAFLAQVAALGRMVCSTDATFYRIEPRPAEATCLDTWKRNLKSIYAQQYDPQFHIPELIPIGIGYAQLATAQQVQQFSDSPKIYLQDIISILISRWGVNAAATVGLFYVFSLLENGSYMKFRNVLNKYLYKKEYNSVRVILDSLLS